MIYKIPIYVEVKVKGDFNPNDLSKAVDLFLAERVQKIIKEHGGFPLNSKIDIFDSTAEKICNTIKAKEVVVSLISKSQVFQKIADQ